MSPIPWMILLFRVAKFYQRFFKDSGPFHPFRVVLDWPLARMAGVLAVLAVLGLAVFQQKLYNTSVFRGAAWQVRMDEALKFGVPNSLPEGSLPTSISVFNHAVKVRQDQEKLKSNVSTIDIVNIVFSDVKQIWERTDIPSCCTSDVKKAKRKISQVIKNGKDLQKTPKQRRKEGFGRSFNILIDLSDCQHQILEACDCLPESKVPEAWRSFLLDQRGPRNQTSKLNRLSLSLRSSDNLPISSQEKESVEASKRKQERHIRDAEQMKKAQDRSNQEMIESRTQIDFCESEDEQISLEESWKSDDIDCDEDFFKRNMMKLNKTSSASVRFGVSDGVTAAICTGYLHDLIEAGH